MTGFLALLPATFVFQQRTRWDREIGEWSYPIYVGHMLVVSTLNVVLPRVGVHGKAAATVLAVVLSVLLAIALNRWVARPVERLRHRVRDGIAWRSPPCRRRKSHLPAHRPTRRWIGSRTAGQGFIRAGRAPSIGTAANLPADRQKFPADVAVDVSTSNKHRRRRTTARGSTRMATCGMPRRRCRFTTHADACSFVTHEQTDTIVTRRPISDS